MLMKLNSKYNWKALDERVLKTTGSEPTGHNYDHTKRVLKNASEIVQAMDAEVDNDVLAAACYLHDISFSNPNKHHIESAEKSIMILPKVGFRPEEVEKIYHAIINHNRAYQPEKPIPVEELSIEAKILCDADRLDSFGSIGIFRQRDYHRSQGIPIFRTIKDKRTQSTYGGLKYIITLAKDMILPEAQVMAKEKLPVMRKFIKQLEKDYS